jgi:hypothetical protein
VTDERKMLQSGITLIYIFDKRTFLMMMDERCFKRA